QPDDPLQLTGSSTPVTCFGGNDGTATAQGSGGTPNTEGNSYIYVWENGQTTATATNLAAGTYWVRVIDANGCQVEIDVIVEQPPQILAIAGPDQLLECGTTSTRLQAEFTSQTAEGETEQFGEWTIVNGPAGGSFSNVNDPSAIFSGT